MAHSFVNLVFHVIFSTKNRMPFLDAEPKSQLFAYMGGIVREMDGKALLINGMADHVHVLLSLPSTLSIAETVRVLKANSSRWVHEKWPARWEFAWQTGYGAFSVSQSNIAPVTQYIANQEEHHRTMTYQAEFLLFLNKHGLSYDERYIWE
jgi:REP element-mobilizing transposase RayT